jgi:type VI secretion system secreted protein VgrG
MPDKFTQGQRFIAVDTPLGADRLLLRTFSGSEGISKLFQFQLDMLSEDFDISFDAIVGQQVTVSVKLADGSSERYFNGYVSRFAQLPGEDRLARYQADVVPWMWFLTRTADCRIFQNKNVPDIVQQVFRDFGFQDFEVRLQGTYDPWEYCVQYRETACNFILRLLEQEGIFFFFRHEKGKHILVLADNPSAHLPCPKAAKVRYEHVVGTGYNRADDVILRWRYQQELRPGKYALRDYNFETPSTSLLAQVNSKINQGGNQKYEIFDYPGEYEKKNQGDAQSKMRIEEQELPHEVVRGDGNCRAFSSGFRFELSEHERKDQNIQYVLTEVTHSAHSGNFHSRKTGEGATYSNSFTCTPHSVPFRPPRITAKHLVQGPQTAVVVGPSGEEIHTDKYGRVKVQFHWDRVGKHDDKSSCWIRASHPWAGKKWGGVWTPRIGQEVIVDFLEGDPDRPIITGRVYNAEQMPPWELPAKQNISGLKSNSTKGGGGYNEFSMDDTKGKELILTHAQKDMTTFVLHDSKEAIGNDRELNVKRNRTEVVGGDMHTTVEGEYRQDVDGDWSLTLGGARDEKVATKFAVDAGQEIHLKAGMKVVIEAGVQLTLKGPGGFVDIGPAGVTIQGNVVLINSGGAAGSGSGVSARRSRRTGVITLNDI